ncbi:hypothetical protein [Gracilibacillus salinarum]|uniref:Uncharacterized protein n=1 Tax=Gracilibacillus salinarum TaxID=2932255 RepID=A0ABY4GSJ1_9BACI|nr:hypothetical protein [Gracilibacillus salinarum]UOQ86197.1 hypothetical protein MUN87_04680 [Gracilibacillus salinarum]
MKNVTITTKMYEETKHAKGYRSMNAKLDGKNVLTSIYSNMTAVDFIEDTIKTVVADAIDNNEGELTINVTLPAEVTLSTALETHLVDKYEADEVVSTVTFA